MAKYLTNKQIRDAKDLSDDDWVSTVAEPIANGVFNRFFRATSNAEEEADMIQEALLYCFKARKRIRPNQNAFSYLTQCSLNAMRRVRSANSKQEAIRANAYDAMQEGELDALCRPARALTLKDIDSSDPGVGG